MTRIGLLSDTHSYWDDKYLKYFEECDEIWHAGDIGSVEVAERLAAFRPFRAVYGNIDGQEIRKLYPQINRFTVDGAEVLMKHIGGYPGNYDPSIRGSLFVKPPKLFNSGHSHILKVKYDKTLGLLHINPEEQESEVTEEEIRMMVDLGGERGTIEAGEKQMIDNIFEFNNITAEECMTHRTDVTAISVEDTPEEIIALIRESGYSRFPVYEDDLDDIVGVLNTRDYLLNMRAESPKPLRDMLRPARFVPESVRADVLFRDMQREKAHLAIVVDEYGGTSGVITMEDLLEEIVGNIYDEYDEAEQPEIAAISEDEWRVSGGVEIKTLNEALDLDLPTDEEFDTLGGLVFAQLTTIPEDGSQPEVHCFGLTIRVTEITDRRVEWAIVKKDPPPEPEEGEGEKKDKDKDSDKDK